MEEEKLISIKTLCTQYSVPETFVQSLREYELIETHTNGNVEYIKLTHLHRIEKMIRLHYELEINLEGLDVVNNLLQQLMELQNENQRLKNRLKLYE